LSVAIVTVVSVVTVRSVDQLCMHVIAADKHKDLIKSMLTEESV